MRGSLNKGQETMDKNNQANLNGMKISFIKRLLPLLLMQLFLSLEAFGDGNVGYIEQQVHQSILDCAETKVTISTYCERNNLDQLCFLQKLDFQYSTSAKPKTQLLVYDNYRSDESLAVYAACVKFKHTHLVVLSGTNLGNCTDGCEWTDAYTLQGKYLGSSGTQFGPTNQKHMPYDDDFWGKYELNRDPDSLLEWKNQINGVNIQRDLDSRNN